VSVAAFGVRQIGSTDEVPAQTLFQAGSISEAIMAVAVVRLIQHGQLNLEADVNRYLHSCKVPANESWQSRITLRHLLRHNSGTPFTVPLRNGAVRQTLFPRM
jgi:CubicO group peptidase (beta-lactamase class C family)